MPPIEVLRPYTEARFSRSSGPGGQHVNKVNTRVTLLFDFNRCEMFSAEAKERIGAHLRTRLSKDGRLRVVSLRHRTQARNRAAAEERLIALLRESVKLPRRRKPTRPTAASQARRLAEKRRKSILKRQRGAAADRSD